MKGTSPTNFYLNKFRQKNGCSNFHELYCHIFRVCVCGSVTNNNTWIRIGYRIYSLWRFIAAQITITSF
jgi:hypothetical protein